MNEQAKLKLAQMKKTGKLLRIISIVTSLLAVALIILYLLMPAGNLYLAGSDSKYGREGGYNYYGWQLTIFGCGYPPVTALAMLENPTTLAGDYIPTAWDFNTNNTLIVAAALPIVVMIVCGIVGSRMKNRGKAVCEWIVSAALLFSAFTLVQCVSLAIPMATNMGTTPFKDNFLTPAVKAGTFTTCAYPIALCVLLTVFALFKIYRGVFLLQQRSFARKNK